MVVNHEDVRPEQDPVNQERRVLGEFAISAWNRYNQTQLGSSKQEKLAARQLTKAARTFSGRLSAYALAHEIVPPEAALTDLRPEAIEAAANLTREALEINSASNRPLLAPETAARLERLLEFAEAEDITEEETQSNSLTLRTVARIISTEDDDLRSIDALARARKELS